MIIEKGDTNQLWFYYPKTIMLIFLLLFYSYIFFHWNHVHFLFCFKNFWHYAFWADSTLANVVNVPKARRASCKKCGEHQPHKVAQYRKGEDSLRAGKVVFRQEAEWRQWAD